MTLLVLGWVICDFVVGVVHREHVFCGVEITVYLGDPRAWCCPVQHINTVLSGRTVPRLCRIDRHWLWPLLKGSVSDQRRNRHSCPHCATVNIRLIGVVGLGASKNNLKAEAPTRHSCHSDYHRMQELSVVFTMIVRVLASYPALKVWDVALQKSHKPLSSS